MRVTKELKCKRCGIDIQAPIHGSLRCSKCYKEDKQVASLKFLIKHKDVNKEIVNKVGGNKHPETGELAKEGFKWVEQRITLQDATNDEINRALKGLITYRYVQAPEDVTAVYESE